MTKRLFVGNLSFGISEEQLQEAFAEYGATAASIPTTGSGKPKGFGYVEVASDRAEQAIAAWNGKELDGRALTVDQAKPRPELNLFGSGFGGGYGGRGRGRGGFSGGGRRW